MAANQSKASKVFSWRLQLLEPLGISNFSQTFRIEIKESAAA
jgi:hypothetical protein